MPRKIMFVLCWTPPEKDDDEGITYSYREEEEKPNEDAKNSSFTVYREAIPAKKKPAQTVEEKVTAWRRRWNYNDFVPPYFSPSLFYSPIAFTLEPMDEIRVIFDRNDEIMSAVTCDCRCDAGALEKRLFLSYKLLNCSTTTSVHVELGTCLASILEANMIVGSLAPVDETLKYNEQDEEDEYIPYWLQP